ncbi:response regulator [Thalassospiraceae bacterium LMO-JJ14]|nr:response regulator [Thalassospiraceae bacterium LMO-JJ14]
MNTEFIVHIVEDNKANMELFQDLMDSVDLPWESHVSAIEFLENFDPEPAGCLILDVRMPRMSGLQLLEKLNEDGIRVPVILATAHGDVPMAIQAMKQGAFDFHEKPINNQALLESVNRALEQRKAQALEAEEEAQATAAYKSLTPREIDVYRLVVNGAMNKQIAYDLNISQRTVEVHRAKVMEKMKARNLADLIKKHIMLHGPG